MENFEDPNLGIKSPSVFHHGNHLNEIRSGTEDGLEHAEKRSQIKGQEDENMTKERISFELGHHDHDTTRSLRKPEICKDISSYN